MSSQVSRVGASTSGADVGSKTINKSGNVASFSNVQTGLVATDAYGDEFKVPDFLIKDILKAIPAHCYERRYTESMYYAIRDVVLVASSMYLANTYIPLIDNAYVRGALWAGYAWMQGLFYTGMWVLAHECGHLAFSDSTLLNDTVGWLFHSYLMVPYFSWKYSHSKHHKATGHMTRDMVFVPKRKEEFLEARGHSHVKEMVADSPIYTLAQLVFQQLGGWIAYLFTNVSGQKYPGKLKFNTNHFNPNSVLFESRDYWYIVLLDIGVLLQAAVVYTWYQKFGGWNMFINWFVPYILCNHWLVFITYLQHSDPKMPHYEPHQWNFARGAGATIDREFGWVGKYIFHDIIETHVLHHYVLRIPFYNAREALEAIKKVMGEHYMHSDENMWKSLWKLGRWCQYVDGKDGVLMFRNINGFGVGTNE